MSKFKKVSRDEYLDFVSGYGKKLAFNVSSICEPPMGQHHDFSDGKQYPDSLVAYEVRMWMDENGKQDHSYASPLWEYYVLNDGEK